MVINGETLANTRLNQLYNGKVLLGTTQELRENELIDIIKNSLNSTPRVKPPTIAGGSGTYEFDIIIRNNKLTTVFNEFGRFITITY